MGKKIPGHYNWYKVTHPFIPDDNCTYIVAALHEDMATTIISKLFKIHIYVDEERTIIENLGPVRNDPSEIIKSPIKMGFNRCSNPLCGARIPPEQYRETHICPSCGEQIYHSEAD